MWFYLNLEKKKHGHKIYALSITMADAIVVPSFTDDQMGNQKGFCFVSFSTAISHRKKTAQEKQKAGREGTEMLIFTLGFTKQSPHIKTAS